MSWMSIIAWMHVALMAIPTLSIAQTDDSHSRRDLERQVEALRDEVANLRQELRMRNAMSDPLLILRLKTSDFVCSSSEANVSAEEMEIRSLRLKFALQEAVLPNSWSDNNTAGRGTIIYDVHESSSYLVVTNTHDVLEECVLLFAQLERSKATLEEMGFSVSFSANTQTSDGERE